MSDSEQASAYPEHDKLNKVAEESQTIGEFIEHLQQKGIHLSQYVEIEGFSEKRLMVISTPIESLLADFFDIDLRKIEQEKREILENLRK